MCGAALLGASLLGACADSATESVAGPPALQVISGETQCTGVLPPGEYERVTVPPGASCFISGSSIVRDVLALPGSSLVMINNEVGSDIEGLQAAQVLVFGGSVGGRIRIDGGGGGGGEGATINGVTVKTSDIVVRQQRTGRISVFRNQVLKGGVRLSGNVTTLSFEVNENTVARSVEVVENTGPSDKRVQFNTADVSIVCKRNSPPFLGRPNFAPTVEGQCSST
jgi:hypothetical protein